MVARSAISRHLSLWNIRRVFVFLVIAGPKKHLFESKTLICLLDRVPSHRRPVYISAIRHFTTGPFWHNLYFFFFPAKNISSMWAYRHLMARGYCIPLENGISWLSFWPTLQGRKEFQVASAASHFRDQGSLTIGCLRFCFLAFLLEIEDEEEEEELTKL